MYQQCIDSAKDRTVRADTKGERENSDEREAWAFDQVSYAVSNVTKKVVHDLYFQFPIADCQFIATPGTKSAINNCKSAITSFKP